MKFTATKISETSHLEVTLHNLKFDNHEPRRIDERLNFRITISIIPSCLSTDYRDKHKTQIYKDHDTKEPCIFDLSLDKRNKSDTSFKTIFKIKTDVGRNDLGKKQFLQFIIHRHSRTRTNKIFLGMFLIPVNIGNKTIEENFYEIDESVIRKNDIFKEHQQRSSKFARDMIRFAQQNRIISSASINKEILTLFHTGSGMPIWPRAKEVG